MADNEQATSGRPSGYKLDRGGQPADPGPFIGLVKKNVDPAKSGRLWVYIESFGAGNPDDESAWRPVRYLPPFYGLTEKSGTDGSSGAFNPGNQQSYGMWFTPPDIGVSVLCFFAEGDPSKGFYVGCIPEPGYTHMIPAIGSSTKYVTDNKNQGTYFSSATAMPVVEINSGNEKIAEDAKPDAGPKPVHAVVAAAMFQQGINNDTERGPIGSTSQRESPSAVYGFSTPGSPIYQGGLDPSSVRKQLEAGTVKPQDAKVTGRQGGHSLVLDDGDIEGNNSLVRIRTSKGHQITMSDTGNFFYFIHANGQTWIELGQEGTVDVYSSNSVNIRSQGDINLHADQDINMYAGRNFNLKANTALKMESAGELSISAVSNMTIAGEAQIGILSSGALALKGQSGYFGVGGALALKGSKIDLNGGGGGASISAPTPIPKTTMDDTTFSTSTGWNSAPGKLESICSRAPAHEPYAYHNLGVSSSVSFEPGQPSVPPGAEPIPPGWEVKAQ